MTRVDRVAVFEETALRRSRRPRSVRVVRAAVTRTHEQPRLREPANRAAQVRAVDGEDLKGVAGDVAYPARDGGGLAVPRIHDRVSIGRETRLAEGELLDRAE